MSSHRPQARVLAGLLAVVAASAAILAGTASSAAQPLEPVTTGRGAPPLRAGAVYTISNAADGNAVVAFNRAADGTLTPAGSFATGGDGNGGSLGSQGALAMTGDGRYVVAVNAGSDTISLLGVRPGGLELLDTAPAQGQTPTSVAVHQSSVFVVNDGSDNVAGFRITRDALAPLPDGVQPLPPGSAPGQVAVTPDGRSLVVSIKDRNELVSFRLSKTGLASPGQAYPTAAPTPFGFAFDRAGHAIVSEAPGSNLSSYQVGRSGVITLINGPVPDGQAAACWVALSKDERSAFVANAGNATISAYSVAHNGEVQLVQPVAGNTVGNPQDLAVSNDGRFLYAVSAGSHAISAFAIGAGGHLTFIGSISDLAMGSASGLVAS